MYEELAASHDAEALLPFVQIPTQLPPQQPGEVQMPGPVAYPQLVTDVQEPPASSMAVCIAPSVAGLRERVVSRSHSSPRPSQATAHDTPRPLSTHAPSDGGLGGVAGGDGGEGGEGGEGGSEGGGIGGKIGSVTTTPRPEASIPSSVETRSRTCHIWLQLHHLGLQPPSHGVAGSRCAGVRPRARGCPRAVAWPRARRPAA